MFRSSLVAGFLVLGLFPAPIHRVAAAPNLPESSIGRKALALAEEGIKAEFRLLSTTERAAVLDILRSVADGRTQRIGDQSPDPSLARITLLAYGDEPAIRTAITRYRDYNSREAWQTLPEDFVSSQQPLLIPLLCEDLYGKGHNQGNFGAEFGMVVPPKCYHSGLLTLRLIRASPVFSQELKAWARSTHDGWRKDRFAFLKTMKLWWEQNKETFERKDYPSVHPPRPVSAPAPPTPPKVVVPAVQEKGFICEFKGRLKNPDDAFSFLYQVAVNGKSKLYKMGDNIGDWKIIAYQEIIIPPYPIRSIEVRIAEDVSELHLVHEITKKECRLVLRKALRLPE